MFHKAKVLSTNCHFGARWSVLSATSDFMAHLCIPTALRFRREDCGGEDRIYSYIESLAHEGGNRMAQILGTEVMDETPAQGEENSDSAMRNCGIANVRLPLSTDFGGSLLRGDRALGYRPLKFEEAGPAIRFLVKSLADEYKTWVPFIDYRGWVWVRVCAQIFLEVSDFEFLATALGKLCEVVGTRQADVRKY